MQDMDDNITRKRKVHPFADFRQIKDLHHHEKIQMCMEHIEQSTEFCTRLKPKGKSRFHGCSCLMILKDETDAEGDILNSNEDKREAVAAYMVHFGDKSKYERQQVMMEWIRYTEENKHIHRRFILPFINISKDEEIINGDDIDDDENGNRPTIAALQSHKVCRAALGYLLDFRYVGYSTCQKAVDNNIIPSHGNRFRRSNNGKAFDEYVRDDLHVYFAEMKMLA